MIRSSRIALPLLLAFTVLPVALPAHAAEWEELCGIKAATDHAEHGAPAAESPARDAGHTALFASMDPMHDGMGQGMEAEDIDRAFVCGMIPHHQGAIDMAKAVLEYGDDPMVRALAEGVIAAQTAEIAQMVEWLKTDGK